MTDIERRFVCAKAAAELSTIVGEPLKSSDLGVVGYLGGDGKAYAVGAKVDVVEFCAEYTGMGLRIRGWRARRGVRRRGWRKVLPDKRTRWREVSKLADVASLL